MLVEHCRHARYVWNLAVEQQQYWQRGRRAPGYNEQCSQLTAARAEHSWLATGSQTVQQQALRDFAQAMSNFSLVRTVARPGAKPVCTKDSGRLRSNRITSSASIAGLVGYGCPRSAACDSACRSRCRRSSSPIG